MKRVDPVSIDNYLFNKKVWGNLRAQVYACLYYFHVKYQKALSTRDIAGVLKQSVLSIRPRVTELIHQGLVKKTGTQVNKYGKRENLYTIRFRNKECEWFSRSETDRFKQQKTEVREWY